MKNHFFYLLFLGLILASCQPENPVGAEYAAIEQASASLSGASVFILDSTKSEICWTATTPDGQFVKGKIHPNLGSLISEKERLLAGFWSGTWDKVSDITSSPTLQTSSWFKMLLDSNQQLGGFQGKKFHMELTQIGRQIIRSDYKTTPESEEQTGVTHQMQGNLTLADSVLYVTLPAQIKFSPGVISVSGNYSLNYNDFGIFSAFRNVKETAQFKPPVQIKYNLFFQRSKK